MNGIRPTVGIEFDDKYTNAKNKLLDFINDVFVWRDHKEMGNYLGEIQSLTSDS